MPRAKALVARASPHMELSEKMVTGQLRDHLGFDGIILTDALNTSAITKFYSADEAAVAAAYRYRFSPALNVYEEPVRCAVSQTVQFRLQ